MCQNVFNSFIVIIKLVKIQLRAVSSVTLVEKDRANLLFSDIISIRVLI